MISWCTQLFLYMKNRILLQLGIVKCMFHVFTKAKTHLSDLEEEHGPLNEEIHPSFLWTFNFKPSKTSFLVDIVSSKQSDRSDDWGLGGGKWGTRTSSFEMCDDKKWFNLVFVHEPWVYIFVKSKMNIWCCGVHF